MMLLLSVEQPVLSVSNFQLQMERVTSCVGGPSFIFYNSSDILSQLLYPLQPISLCQLMYSCKFSTSASFLLLPISHLCQLPSSVNIPPFAIFPSLKAYPCQFPSSANIPSLPVFHLCQFPSSANITPLPVFHLCQTPSSANIHFLQLTLAYFTLLASQPLTLTAFLCQPLPGRFPLPASLYRLSFARLPLPSSFYQHPIPSPGSRESPGRRGVVF